MAPRPPRASRAPSVSCTQLAAIALIASLAAWGGTLLGFFLAKRPYGARAAPERPPSSALRVAARGGSGGGGTADDHAPPARAAAAAAAAAPLRAALDAAAASLAVLPGERLPLAHYTLVLTGHPPLVSRSDVSATGEPDFENFGLPAAWAAPHFFVADPFDGPPAAAAAAALVGDSPFRAVAAAEDTIRDVFAAALLSPGRVRKGLGGGRPVCKASPVTAPFACLASLRAARATAGAFAADGAPRRAADGGPLVLDIGHTAGGYYAQLAAAAGVSALAVDTQPQCALWARVAARASGAEHLVDALAAVPLPPAAVGRKLGARGVATAAARVRTGCIGTLTTMPHAAASAVDAFYGGALPPTPPEEATGQAAAERARKLAGTEGAAALGGAGGGATVDVPVASVDDILCATYGGALCEGGGGGGGGGAAPPLIVLAKVDARGREADVLKGMARVLASPALRPRNLLVEVNKNHMAAALGLPSALAAARSGGAAPGDAGDDALVRGYSLGDLAISDADNAVLAARLVDVMTTLLAAGYEVLVSDRGWWCAQAPFTAVNVDKTAPVVHDADVTVEKWAEKLSKRGEVDIWAYVPE